MSRCVVGLNSQAGVTNILAVGADSIWRKVSSAGTSHRKDRPYTEPRWRLAACTGLGKTERHARAQWEQVLGCMAGCAQHNVA
jgi:hypothetical protein